MSDRTPFRSTRSRRMRILALGVAVLTAGALLGACGDDDDDNNAASSSTTSTTAQSGTITSTKLEVFSWWTGSGEATGLQKMIDIWKGKYPGVEFVNAAVAGGAGSNAKAVLAQRLAANDPPDSFQGHAGAELSDYIKAGQIMPLNEYYSKWGLNDVFPKDLIDQITVDGKIYSVPVNIHRANVLWYNPSVLTAAGIASVPKTMDEFFAALDKAKAAGKTPLALGEQWTVKHLMETVFIADLGADGWAKLWTKDADWNSAGVTKAINDFKKLLTYVNTNYASLTWQDAAKLVADGKAAFNVMGDWAESYFRVDLGKTPKTDYAWAVAPGTDGIYDWLSDSFTLPKGAPHADAAVAWLELAGSKDGQDAFNPAKGSIPARKDADVSKYGVYLQDAMAQWKTAKLAGSLAHGVVANTAWSTDIDGALGLFLQNKDVAKFQKALKDAHAAHTA